MQTLWIQQWLITFYKHAQGFHTFRCYCCFLQLWIRNATYSHFLIYVFASPSFICLKLLFPNLTSILVLSAQAIQYYYLESCNPEEGNIGQIKNRNMFTTSIPTSMPIVITSKTSENLTKGGYVIWPDRERYSLLLCSFYLFPKTESRPPMGF